MTTATAATPNQTSPLLPGALLLTALMAKFADANPQLRTRDVARDWTTEPDVIGDPRRTLHHLPDSVVWRALTAALSRISTAEASVDVDQGTFLDVRLDSASPQVAEIVPPGIYQKFFDGLAVARSLEQGWNGYGAGPPNAEAVRAAEKLVAALPTDLSNPLVGVAEEGAVYLKFSRSGTLFVLTVEPNRLHLLVRPSAGATAYIDNVAFNGSTMPLAVLHAIAGAQDA